MWRVRLELGLRQATVDNWIAETDAQARRQRDWVVAKLVLSAIGLLLASLLVRDRDRWTRGYRRVAAILTGGALAAIVTVAVWAC